MHPDPQRACIYDAKRDLSGATMAKTNLFGDARAEHDHEMLDSSFYESQNYKTLFESRDRFIVVGRRGTGKSALTYRLSKDWTDRKFRTIVIAPSEEQVIGIRPIAQSFGGSVTRIRAGIKLAWRYALLLEVAHVYEQHYRTAQLVVRYDILRHHLKTWVERGSNPFDRLRATLRDVLHSTSEPEDRIADLSQLLQLNRITEEVAQLTKSQELNVVVLLDRLDEGYEPDTIGVGIVDGLIYGTDEVRNALGANLQAIVFLRDNIFRGVQQEDPDFSRNLEGQVLRLHWDPEELFYMVCKRIRVAFSIDRESDVKVWNAITSGGLQRSAAASPHGVVYRGGRTDSRTIPGQLRLCDNPVDEDARLSHPPRRGVATAPAVAGVLRRRG